MRGEALINFDLHFYKKHPIFALFWQGYEPFHCGNFHFWWTRGGSNSRPLRCERNALPAALRAQILGLLQENSIAHRQRFVQPLFEKFVFAWREWPSQREYMETRCREKGRASALFSTSTPYSRDHPRLHRFFYPLKPWERKNSPAGQLPSGGRGIISGR